MPGTAPGRAMTQDLLIAETDAANRSRARRVPARAAHAQDGFAVITAAIVLVAWEMFVDVSGIRPRPLRRRAASCARPLGPPRYPDRKCHSDDLETIGGFVALGGLGRAARRAADLFQPGAGCALSQRDPVPAHPQGRGRPAFHPVAGYRLGVAARDRLFIAFFPDRDLDGERAAARPTRPSCGFATVWRRAGGRCFSKSACPTRFRSCSTE